MTCDYKPLFDVINDYDTALITAFDSIFTKDDNEKRSVKMNAMIQFNRYSMIDIKKLWYSKDEPKEGAKSFFIIDKLHKGNLSGSLTQFSNELRLTHELYIPRYKKELIYPYLNPESSLNDLIQKIKYLGIQNPYSSYFRENNDFIEVVAKEPWQYVILTRF